MWEKRYLCDIERPDESAVKDFLNRGVQYLDQERKRKISGKKQGKNMLLSAVAGLLIQKAMADYLDNPEVEAVFSQERTDVDLCRLTIEELLAEASKRPVIDLSYFYGNQGKPYLVDYPIYFNISHSGNCVLLAACEEEIGVDLQMIGNQDTDRVAGRFFSEEEKTQLEKYEGMEKQKLFYRLWTQKEAYGKLTGEGILKVVGLEMKALEKAIRFETDIVGDYVMCICRKAETE